MFLERDEMKFAILYTLKRYTEPVSMPVLSEILTNGKVVMGYFDLAESLEELEEDGYIDTKYYKNDRCYYLSGKGIDTNMYFFERVPKSIRRRIDDTVGKLKFNEQVDPNAVKAEILPVAPRQYMASLQMLDGGSPILELKILAGSRAEAERAAKILESEAAEIYKNLIEKITNK